MTWACTQVSRASTSATRKISASPGGASSISLTVTLMGWLDSPPIVNEGMVSSPVRLAISDTVHVRDRLTCRFTMVVLEVRFSLRMSKSSSSTARSGSPVTSPPTCTFSVNDSLMRTSRRSTLAVTEASASAGSSIATLALVLIAELAPQQTAGVVRHPAQPLLHGLHLLLLAALVAGGCRHAARALAAVFARLRRFGGAAHLFPQLLDGPLLFRVRRAGLAIGLGLAAAVRLLTGRLAVLLRAAGLAVFARLLLILRGLLLPVGALLAVLAVAGLALAAGLLLLLLLELSQQVQVMACILVLRHGRQRLLVRLDRGLEFALPGERIAPVVGGVHRVQSGEGLRARGIVAGPIAGGRLPGGVLEEFGGLAGPALFQRARGLLVRGQPQVLPLRRLGRPRQRHRQHDEDEQPTTAERQRGQRQQCEHQPGAAVVPELREELPSIASAAGPCAGSGRAHRRQHRLEVAVVHAQPAVDAAAGDRDLLQQALFEGRQHHAAGGVGDEAAVRFRQRPALCRAHAQHRHPIAGLPQCGGRAHRFAGGAVTDQQHVAAAGACLLE